MNDALSSPGVNRRFRPDWPVLSLRLMSLAAIALAIYIRVALRSAPFDDAEGDFSYTGQLMLQGIPPYKLASNLKFPGTSAVYALFMALFGQTPAAIHLGFAALNLATTVALYFLGRRLFGDTAGWVAAASYALLSVGTGVYGTLAMAEHAMILPVLLAGLLLLRWKESPKPPMLFWAGFLLGLAVLMKQSGAFFALFGLTYVLWSCWRGLGSRPTPRTFGRKFGRDLGLFGLGALLPLGATGLLLWEAGVFAKFWFWTVTYARAYASHVTPAGGFRILAGEFRRIVAPDEGLWLSGGAGLFLAMADIVSRGAPARRAAAVWAVLFLVFSFLSVCPGFYFRPYYFVLMLPAVALLGGAGMERAGDYLTSGQRTALFAIVLIFAMLPLCLVASKQGVIRDLYLKNPFLIAGEYIKDHSTEDARIAVLGSDPQVYFYARRHSATDHVIAYSLGEDQPFALQMQDETISDIEAVKPEYIVAVNMYPSWNFLPGFCQVEPQGPKPCDIFRPNDREDASNTAYAWDDMAGAWLFRPDFPTRIFDWFAEWGPQNYDVVGVITLLSGTETGTVWGRAAESYVPAAPGLFLRIYKRKP